MQLIFFTLLLTLIQACEMWIVVCCQINFFSLIFAVIVIKLSQFYYGNYNTIHVIINRKYTLGKYISCCKVHLHRAKPQLIKRIVRFVVAVRGSQIEIREETSFRTKSMQRIDSTLFCLQGHQVNSKGWLPQSTFFLKKCFFLTKNSLFRKLC